MGSVKFTVEQQKVIDTRARNLLVSAAAGSGKTAVLVERIVEMVTDPINPLDIDRLLVVTFTNAAAAEMRERVGDAFEKKLDVQPNNKHLHRQLVLLSNANIMTIHAFCLKVIRNHFNEIHLDPSFRIGDENELLLLKSDVIKELLEEKYAEGDENFLKFIESYAGSKSDEAIEDLILTAHRFAWSNPWPQQWLKYHIEKLNIHTEEQLIQTEYYQNLLQLTEEGFTCALELFNKAKQVSCEENGPVHYLEAIETYKAGVKHLQETLVLGYEKTQEAFSVFEHIKLSMKRTGFDQDLKEKAKRFIDLGKEELLTLKNTYFPNHLKDLISDIKGTYDVISVLGELTLSFSSRYQKLKEEKNLIDFTDIEHFALNILVKQEEESYEATDVAVSFRAEFEEILIDEYQDSNLVQETILKAVSREDLGSPNMFMVGDVKQSIYKFRLAKPELFMDKYRSYSDEESLFQRINLHRNFRSRSQVIDFINYFFKQTMSKNMGDVTYDDTASLHLGAQYEEIEGSHYDTEILLLHETDEDEEQDLTQRQLEAQVIAERIQQLLHGEVETLVFDRKKNHYRKVEYRDIVILLRSLSGWTDVILEALSNYHIPAFSSTTTGYFETLEIRTMMAMLKLIDNPHQDIPLVAVLRSPIVGLKGEELVRLRKAFEESGMYEALTTFIEGCLPEDQLGIKLKSFLENLHHFREISRYLPIDELIHDIFKRTHYDHYCVLMPNGLQRKANLELFIDKACAYEKSSYRGVFNFIRYVENIKKYAIETGEATIFSESDNLVKIMSIHKSKGLEFPVVILAGLGKMFNKQDLRQAIVFHQDLGIGSDYVDAIQRFRVSTLPKNMIKAQLSKELMSEELRILYVALTRAKEKLILTGSVKNLDQKITKWGEGLYDTKVTISDYLLTKANSYLDWLMTAFMRHPDGKALREWMGTDRNIPVEFSDENSHLTIKLISTATPNLESLEVEIEQREERLLKLLKLWEEESPSDHNEISQKLDWSYSFNALLHSKVQMSVSDIKRMHREEEEIITFEKPVLTPKFIEVVEGLTAAEKGTAFHKVMRYLDLSLEPQLELIKGFLDQLREKKILTELERTSISEPMLLHFLESALCTRMAAAGKSLKREVPFVVGIHAHEMYEGLDTEDMIMIQGVIDAFFEEEGQIILVDYKTDFILEGQEDVLLKRYREQMTYYKRAIEQIYQKNVKQIMLYSFYVSKAIEMKA